MVWPSVYEEGFINFKEAGGVSSRLKRDLGMTFSKASKYLLYFTEPRTNFVAHYDRPGRLPERVGCVAEGSVPSLGILLEGFFQVIEQSIESGNRPFAKFALSLRLPVRVLGISRRTLQSRDDFLDGVGVREEVLGKYQRELANIRLPPV